MGRRCGARGREMEGGHETKDILLLGVFLVAVFGLVAPWYYNLQGEELYEIVFDPLAVAQDPLGKISHAFGTFLYDQGSNAATSAIMLLFVLFLPLIWFFNCLSTSAASDRRPRSLLARALWTLAGMNVAYAMSF